MNDSAMTRRGQPLLFCSTLLSHSALGVSYPYKASILSEQTYNHIALSTHILHGSQDREVLLMSGSECGSKNSLGFILVLFILLVIVACSCRVFG
ncbi:sporulation protein YjcZ [Bacillus sp. FJAT-26390]|uniref:sporulation protein YjcZ n=1 Tax=Bacillus sp. FJAT-26390 TaxID=1743142 RepID=UPI0009E4DAEB